MKGFKKEQEELNYLILSTLDEHKPNAISAKAIELLIDNTYPIGYPLGDIVGRLKALGNRDIVRRVLCKIDNTEKRFTRFGYWHLTDKGIEAYNKGDWAIDGRVRKYAG